MPDPTHINPHLLFYIRGETHPDQEANPPIRSTTQEFRQEVDLGCYSAATLNDLLDDLVEFMQEWVENHEPLPDPPGPLPPPEE